MTEPMPPIEQQTPTERQQQPLQQTAQVFLPRITIKYCTQCKWMLRAAYVCIFFSIFCFFFQFFFGLIFPNPFKLRSSCPGCLFGCGWDFFLDTPST